MTARIEWKWNRDNRRMILVLVCPGSILDGCPLSLTGSKAEAASAVAEINERRQQHGLPAIAVL